ncbi:MAG: cellobiose phosphorylase, partial [Acidimicrobiia bacterium]|nr:cellobiose phosphorylase [Acidimicrobiia bacterium]
IPSEYRSIVTIPALIGSPGDVRHLLQQLERHHLGNPDPNLRFALLTDFLDSERPDNPDDDVLLEQARQGINELNRRHGSPGHRPFHLLHRQRLFNPHEQRWMGWERKRGKLDEFNRLIQGDEETSYVVHEGERADLVGIRYVITLDADTSLPQGAAARLVGTLAHPLNQARVDPASGRIVAGFSVIQPRVETTPESGNRSHFARLYCGDTAIDIYSRAVSNTYQDLFGTGVYVGKAIYDVGAFAGSLAGRVPENALVSHDLFEGLHSRVALATDIVVYEDYPATYLASAHRTHRWIRGDWQLLPWLGRRVPSATGDRLPNRLSTMDRWKIIDNLRRSLLPSAFLVMLVSAWTWLPGDPRIWTLLAILAPTSHLPLDVLAGLTAADWPNKPTLPRSLSTTATRSVLVLAFMPHQVAVTVDAIVRALWRLGVSRRRLLEWRTSAQVAATTDQTRTSLPLWRAMAIAPVMALLAGCGTALFRLPALPWALPLLLLWTVAPEIADRLSDRPQTEGEGLDAAEIDFIRRVARRTWFFFEVLVSPDDHWLPPDNMQEDPNNGVAHRTSPTNIGMLLLSTLAAYDLGYIGPEQLTLRLRNTLTTVSKLEHYRGHLFNWYQTRTLEPLPPHYVSTVDSGNLAASLWAVETGATELIDAPILGRRRWEGLLDTVAVLEEHLVRIQGTGDRPFPTRIEAQIQLMRNQAAEAITDDDRWLGAIERIDESCVEIERFLLELVVDSTPFDDPEVLAEIRIWLDRVHGHLNDMRLEIARYFPWYKVAPATDLSAEGTSTDDPRHPCDTMSEIHAALRELFPLSLPLSRLESRCQEASAMVAHQRRRHHGSSGGPEAGATTIDAQLDTIDAAIDECGVHARRLLTELDDLIPMARDEALGMDFSLVYDHQ